MRRATDLAIAVVIVAAGTASAQDTATEAPAEPNPWFLRVGYSPARVLTASHLQSGEDVTRALTFEVGRQTDGTRDWHRIYDYPSYGVGLYIGMFDQKQELGQPFAAYGFFSWPFPVSTRTQVTTDFGLGVSWRWREFDPKTNPTNTALGSDAVYHVDAGVYLRYLASPRANIYAGLDITHWSNGGTRQPNLGLAVVGPKVGVRYNFAPQVVPSRARPEDLPRFVPSWELVVGGAGSRKNVNDRDFGTFNITAGLQRHFYRFGKVAAGADVTYDGSAPTRAALGIYGGYEHVIAGLGILAQLGSTLGRGFEDEEIARFYQRCGARFYLSKDFWGMFAVRSSNFSKANALELGFGYRARW